MGATLKAEYLGQRRDVLEVDDKGWYALGSYRVGGRLENREPAGTVIGQAQIKF